MVLAQGVDEEIDQGLLEGLPVQSVVMIPVFAQVLWLHALLLEEMPVVVQMLHLNYFIKPARPQGDNRENPGASLSGY
jgi:hypothetical protein